jgi:diguanylate cyclase (GGDEF)-like protein
LQRVDGQVYLISENPVPSFNIGSPANLLPWHHQMRLGHAMWLNGSVEKKLGFLISGVLTAIFILATVWFGDFAQRSLEEFLHQQARVLYQQIELTHYWNATYGGVYVRKLPGVETSKYLYEVGPGHGKPGTVVPEFTDKKGNVYTLKNPALMTRELSELTANNVDIRFHLTSLKTINPNNAPDDFETRSLKQFETGLKESSEFSQDNGKHYFRFMAPLYVEQSCLGCHGFQGYKIGDVRGGISLALPVDNELKLLNASRMQFIVASAILLVLVILTIILGSRYVVTYPLRIMQHFASSMGKQQQLPGFLMARHDEVGLLAQELTAANATLLTQKEEILKRTEQLERESHTDTLTGLYNSRYLFSEGARLYERWQRDGAGIAILMIDLDRLKRINDQFGHKIGDEVLLAVARKLKQQCRPYDIVARYGGEEFVVMLEAASFGSGDRTAQRICQSIVEKPFQIGELTLRVTVSIGVYEGISLGDFDSTLRKADEALYQAKESGRNRVVSYTENEM